MANRTQNFYTNPAFCQKSEFFAIGRGRALSPARSDNSARQSPLGAQSSYRGELPEDHEYEQEFYEEMLVDDTGCVKEKNILVISSPHKDTKALVEEPRAGSRYAPVDQRTKTRYEYVPVEYDDTQQHQARVHRYALIPTDEDIERSPKSKGARYGYAHPHPHPHGFGLVPMEEIQNKGRYALVADHDSRYEYIDEERSPPRTNAPRSVQRQDSYRNQRPQTADHRREESQGYQTYQPARRGNPAATRKLHELLQSPPSKPIMSPGTPRKVQLQRSPSNVVVVKKPASRAQQQLTYSAEPVKKSTAVVQPMRSVYGETTVANHSESWTNLKKPAAQGTLAVAALMMFLCGGLTSGLCFYMIAFMGKHYFLDFGIAAGFTCLLLGVLGFRTRNCYWLPNRNYISGT